MEGYTTFSLAIKWLVVSNNVFASSATQSSSSATRGNESASEMENGIQISDLTHAEGVGLGSHCTIGCFLYLCFSVLLFF
jgi:hypothetical protein